MRPDTITITSRIDTKTFQRFALFDTFTRQKHYKLPLVFACIMLAFGAVCFAMQGRASQAGLLGTVLSGIGLFLPFFYFGNYLLSIRQQAKKLKLDTPRHVYTVSMTSAPDGITIVSADEKGGTLRKNWTDLFMAYRTKGCIYLFISSRQAFLLPDEQANVSADELWAFLGEQLPKEKMVVLKK